MFFCSSRAAERAAAAGAFQKMLDRLRMVTMSPAGAPISSSTMSANDAFNYRFIVREHSASFAFFQVPAVLVLFFVLLTV